MRAVDTNVLLYHFTGDRKIGPTCKRILERIEKGEQVLIPLVVLKEITYYMYLRDYSLISIEEVLRRFNKENIKITTDDYSMLLEGIHYAESYEITINDGIIVAVMKKEGVNEIYTNDEHFDKVPGIKRFFE